MFNLTFEKFERIYVATWCTLMPITGTLLIPRIQGTIPAYCLAIGSLALVFFKVESGEITPVILRYAKTFISILMLWLVLLAGSQVGLIASNRHDFGDVNMVDSIDTTTILLRTTLYTQSLYMLSCVLIALYFRYFFKEEWMKYVYWGGFLLAIYGIYEWIFFAIFQFPGDFLVNRAFGEHTASWSQGINFGGIQLLRIKSTLGEPTFFAAVVIPYLFMALDARKFILTGMLLFCAIFSTSTACYIGLSITLLIKSLWTGKIRWDYISLLMVVGAFLGGMALYFPETFQSTFADKFSGDNDSGSMRMNSFATMVDFLNSFTIPNWIFGVGFGYTYLGVLTAVLVNTGIIGLTVFLYVFLRPILLLPILPGYQGLKAGLMGVLILCGLSLSELFLPTTWMFLGLGYFKLEQYAEAQNELARGRFQYPRDQVQSS